MIKIKQDFQKLIPPLSAEEKNQLESNIVVLFGVNQQCHYSNN